MTKFEQRGVEFQYDASCKQDALKSFQYSCSVCCSRGMRIECDRCAIRATHEMTMAYFASVEQKKAVIKVQK
ncbi:hypothetical protein [Intestinimonas butyriciproducens]|uniref:hypothetical protein n=1 Tax=Intestinimonas butyriciproducens TaxID=1297617 RepID=UPI0018978876|nr:hypothetical protein [Intestinimonas butyriciproducens]MDB7829145.1 hypothetical protein [Intestinimonas butyriciproducens]